MRSSSLGLLPTSAVPTVMPCALGYWPACSSSRNCDATRIGTGCRSGRRRAVQARTAKTSTPARTTIRELRVPLIVRGVLSRGRACLKHCGHALMDELDRLQGPDHDLELGDFASLVPPEEVDAVDER